MIKPFDVPFVRMISNILSKDAKARLHAITWEEACP